jgi:hypothetical protein
MQHPAVTEGDLDACWDGLWLYLAEQMGWQSVARVDDGLLREQIRIAVESDRLRGEGWSREEIEKHETRMRLQALVAQSRSKPGEEFDVSGWAGPLLASKHRDLLRSRQKDWQGLHSPRHEPAEYVSVWNFDPNYVRPVHPSAASPEQIESMLSALGAPATCRALRLFEPLGDDWVHPGSELPLRQALEIAIDLNDGQDQILLCLPGRLAYSQTHNHDRMIVYRPTG